MKEWIDLIGAMNTSDLIDWLMSIKSEINNCQKLMTDREIELNELKDEIETKQKELEYLTGVNETSKRYIQNLKARTIIISSIIRDKTDDDEKCNAKVPLLDRKDDES